MKVSFYATLRQVIGAKTVEFDLPEGITVQQLLDEMICSYPVLKHELLNEAGELYQHVHIFVNGRDAAFLDRGMESELSKEDTIGVSPR
jgi:molybdopterin synthase sulfur carrier subunit